MSKLSIVLSAAFLVTASPQWPTLRIQLETRGLPVAGIDDLDRAIASHAVEDASEWFAIAYYLYDGAGPNRPSTELRIRIYDRRRARWTSAVFDGDSLKTGVVSHVRRQAGWVYLDTHLSPSAGALLVLTDDLKLRRRLYGWSEAVLPDGRVVYENSMVHFAPAHPGSLNLYDPGSDRDVRLYPPATMPEDSPSQMTDRRFERVEQLDSGRVAVTVIEQDVTIGPENTGSPSGPRREFRLVCDIAGGEPPRCAPGFR